MTAADKETSPKQSKSRSGKNNKSTPPKRKPEKVGKQTIKPERKNQEAPAEPNLSGNDMITSPVRNPQMGKQTSKPEEKVKKAPNVSQSEKSTEAATERKPKKAVKKPIIPDEVKESKATVVSSEVGSSIKASPASTPEKTNKKGMKPDKKGKRAPDSPSAAVNVKGSPVRSKAKSKARKGRPKVKTKRSRQSPQQIYYRPKMMRKKELSKSKAEETKGTNIAAQGNSNKVKRRGKNRMRQAPFVQSYQHRVGVARGPLKYRLQRAEPYYSNYKRVQPNRRVTRKRVKSTKRKDFSDYGMNFWDNPELKVDLFDLSSIECGSYEDKVDAEEEENNTLKHKASGQFPDGRYQKTEDLEWGNSLDLEALDDLKIPANFAFNPSAPEFIPKESIEKKSVIFTLAELLKSVKGQELPTMPALKPFIKSK